MTASKEDAPLASPAPEAEVRFHLQLTLRESTQEKLCYATSLLSHAVPSGDLAQVLDHALDALIARLERRKFAATHRPSARGRGAGARAGSPAEVPTARRPVVVAPKPDSGSVQDASPDAPSPAIAEPAVLSSATRAPNSRYIPTHVRHAVWERDGGQCTFEGEDGHRCRATRFLEFDHVDPVARGGLALVDRIRLRCRPHNQFEAERIFGAGFMQARRAEAAAARGAAAQVRDVISALRRLGVRADEARQAAATANADAPPGATLEERMRAALRQLAPRRGVRRVANGGPSMQLAVPANAMAAP